MKLDGDKFRQTRLRYKDGSLVINEDQAERTRYCPHKIGTQAWLAELADVDEKTIQNLEGCNASRETIVAVSKELGFNGLYYVYGHGESHIKCGANKSIDFRPMDWPDETESYLNSNLMVTIDPLHIEFQDIDLKSVTLKEIKASITFLDCKLTWWSYVKISQNTNDWLGQVEETDRVKIDDFSLKSWTIMFKQEKNSNLSWSDFVKKVEASDDEYFELDVRLIFSYFEKSFPIKIDRNELEENLSKNRKRHNSPDPYRAQVQPTTLA